MFLSLHLIAERLQIPDCMIWIQEIDPHPYLDLSLYPNTAASCCELDPEILYLTDQIPELNLISGHTVNRNTGKLHETNRTNPQLLTATQTTAERPTVNKTTTELSTANKITTELSTANKTTTKLNTTKENPPKTTAGIIWIVPQSEFSAAQKAVCTFPYNLLLIGTQTNFRDVFQQISQLTIVLRRQLDAFRTAVYTDHDLQRLIEMFFEILGNPAYLVDSSFKVLAIDRKHEMRYLSASWKRLEDDQYLPFDLVSHLINSKELSIMESEQSASLVNSQYFYVPFINYNLRQRGKVKGHLFVAGMRKNIQTSDIELTEYLGNYILEAMNRNSAFQNARGDYYEHFMRDMFCGKLVDPVPIRQQMMFLGFQPEDYYTIAVLHTSPEHGLSDERIANQLERCCGAKSVLYQDKMAALFSHGKRINLHKLQKDLERIHNTLNCEIGVSDTFQGFYDLNTYYLQAEWALTCPATITQESSASPIRYYQNYALAHILTGFSKQEKWKTLLPPKLLYLQQYDQIHHTEFLKTLYLYLRFERSVLETATELHIHRNTLSYRMEKIIALCHFDLEDPVLRMRLLLSLEAIQFLDSFP